MSHFRNLFLFQGQPSLDPTDNKSWVSGRSEAEALKKAAKAFGVKDISTITLKQARILICIKFL